MSSIRAGDVESPPFSANTPLLPPKESAPRTCRKAVFVSVLLALTLLLLLVFAVIHRTTRSMDATYSCPYRSGFHFQPKKNWMNDPSGPMYYNGWYHLFYQHNENGAVWANISWGHAVSKDLLNWVRLPLALVPDRPYDIDGVWTGSATVLQDGRVIMIYTGLINKTIQVQNIAVPEDLSDPFLIKWVKLDHINPVIYPPPDVSVGDFRDPSTARYEHKDDTWQVVIGSKDASNNGIALVYSTSCFTKFTLLEKRLHTVKKVGMWECIDFYPVNVSQAGANQGLDPSVSPSTGTKHVLKASTQDNGSDYYALGTYNPVDNTWVPDDEGLDVGLGLRYDWGMFYASKTFYDKVKQRRILWGWVKEADSEKADINKGWASLQSIPRMVFFDYHTKTHLLTLPIEEVESLRTKQWDFSGLAVGPGSISKLEVDSDAQLDIEVEFTIDNKTLEATNGEDVEYECGTSGGSTQRGLLGPFGLLVLANKDLTERTAAYFYVSKKSNGSLVTHFCHDELRSSKENDTEKSIVGHTVPVLNEESFTLRVLVDHSIVESFAQGGRASVTSRVYPTEAIYKETHLYVFNNATGASVNALGLKVWRMKSVSYSKAM